MVKKIKHHIAFNWQLFLDSFTKKAGAYFCVAVVGLLVWLYKIDHTQAKILNIVEAFDTNKVNKFDFVVYKMYFEGQLDENDLRLKNVETNIDRILNAHLRTRGEPDTIKKKNYRGKFIRRNNDLSKND